MHVRRTARAVSQFYDNYMQETGITAAQFTLLIALVLAPDTSVTKLSTVLGTDRTTLSRSLKPLEEAGIVLTEPGEDKRKKVVTLTKKGKSVLDKAIPCWMEAQEAFVDKMGQGNWQDFISKLNTAAVISKI